MDSRQIGERDLTVTITNYRQQDITLDPSTILDVMIHESLSDNTTHGEVTVLDIGGFEERIPIVGEEYINIKLLGLIFLSKYSMILFTKFMISRSFIDDNHLF